MRGGALLNPLPCPSLPQFCRWQWWLLGGTCTGQGSAPASEALRKLKPHKILKEQRSPAVLPREALATGDPF